MFGQACIVIGPEIIAIYIYAGNVVKNGTKRVKMGNVAIVSKPRELGC